jgi:hypothetical protein
MSGRRIPLPNQAQFQGLHEKQGILEKLCPIHRSFTAMSGRPKLSRSRSPLQAEDAENPLIAIEPR